jgi:hypothetical protein
MLMPYLPMQAPALRSYRPSAENHGSRSIQEQAQFHPVNCRMGSGRAHGSRQLGVRLGDGSRRTSTFAGLRASCRPWPGLSANQPTKVTDAEVGCPELHQQQASCLNPIAGETRFPCGARRLYRAGC